MNATQRYAAQERKEETRIVKTQLRKLYGFDVASVTHGTGTSRGWLDVKVYYPDVRHDIKLDGRPWSVTPAELHQFRQDRWRDGIECVTACDGCARIKRLGERVEELIEKITGRKGEYANFSFSWEVKS